MTDNKTLAAELLNISKEFSNTQLGNIAFHATLANAAKALGKPTKIIIVTTLQSGIEILRLRNGIEAFLAAHCLPEVDNLADFEALAALLTDQST